MGTKSFTYTLDIDAEIKGLTSKTEQVKKALKSIVDAGQIPDANKLFGKIDNALTRLKEKASAPITSVTAFASIEKDIASVRVALAGLEKGLTDFSNSSTSNKLSILPPDTLKLLKQADVALQNFDASIAEAAQKTEKLVAAEKALNNALTEQQKRQEAVNAATTKQQGLAGLLENVNNSTEAIKHNIAILKKWQEAQEAYATVQENGNTPDKRSAFGEFNYRKDRKAANAVAGNLGLDVSTPEALSAAIQKLNEDLAENGREISRLETNYKRATTTLRNAETNLELASNAANDAQKNYTELNEAFGQSKIAKTAQAFRALKQQAKALDLSLEDIPAEPTAEGIELLKRRILELQKQGLDKVSASCNTASNAFQAMGNVADNTAIALDRNKESFIKLDERASNTSAFVERIKQFVGLQGAANLMRSAFRNAFETIKDLDSVMTEMSVVTDTDISGYWDQLPQYTQRASEMGLAIRDVYKADTLFYQQGLKTNEVVELSTETMKMARIAGLDTAEATDRMTAALRGFNMELNETNAQKVADVYSQLAAITASDVDEISAAMTKTASIAASAGMEFETTAAFLSQIIETTRESAETAGTAMKTVIARFQELKKDPSEIGEVDGEIVDANKIETALRSVGVSLRDANGQFRELDDVFMELSGKWDSLDTNTQRYIATIAAGSRQQSRFIAMMSDYNRTVELVSAANNSAGASNKQFEKTMDGLEAKLNNLKNAWDSFTMGITDSDLVKVGVDLLTQFLTAINKITDAFGEFSGAAKIALLVAALYLGDKAIKAFLSSFAKSKSVFTAFGASVTGVFSGVKSDIDSAKTKFEMFNAAMKRSAKGTVEAFGAAPRVAMQQYQQALERIAKAQEKKSAAERSGTKDASAYALAVAMEKQATLDLGSAQVMLRNSLGLTEEELEDALFLTQYGITLDNAATLAKNEKAMAILREKAALDGLNDEQMEANMQNTAGLLLDDAESFNKLGDSLGDLGRKLSNFDPTKAFESIKTGLGSLGKGFVSAAKNVWTFIASIWPLLILIAALAAAIALLVVYIKHLQSQTPEAKLARAEAAASKAADAAEEAAEAFERLDSSLEDLEDKYDALNDLTKGTKEWNKQVKDINKSVMDLISQYPELAKFYELNSDGVMVMKEGAEADISAILSEKETESLRANAISYGAQQIVSEAEKDVAYEGLSNGAKFGSQELISAITWGATLTGAAGGAYGGAVGGAALGSLAPGAGTAIGGVAGGILGGLAGGIIAGVGAHAAASAAFAGQEKSNQQYTEEIAKAMATGEITDATSKTEISEWIQENYGMDQTYADLWADELAKNGEELREFGETVKATDDKMNAYYNSLAVQAAQAVNTTGMSMRDKQQINAMANEAYGQMFINKAKDDINNMSSEEYKKYAEAEAKKIYGDDASVDKNGNVKYKDENGDEQTVSKEDFVNQLAGAEGVENMTEALENLPHAIDSAAKGFEKTIKGSGSAIERLFAGAEGSQLTREDLDKLAQGGTGAIAEAWSALSAEDQASFGSYDNFLNTITEAQRIQDTEFASIDRSLKQFGVNNELNKKLTSENAKALTNSMLQIITANGPEAGKEFMKGFNDFTANMTTEDANKFASLIGSIDPQDAAAWDGLKQTITDMGIVTGKSEEELDAFIANAKEAANALQTIDFTTLVENLQKIGKIIANINAGTQSRTFTKEDYETIVNGNPSLAKDFIITYEGYEYIGSSMEMLGNALVDNTIALTESGREQLTNQIDAGKIAEGIVKSKNYDLSSRDEWSTDDEKNFVTAMIKSYTDKGIDLGQLGIKGIGTHTTAEDISKMSKEDIATVTTDIITLITTYAQKETTLSNTMSDATILAMLSNSLGTNIGLRSSGTEEERAVAYKVIGSQARETGVDENTISAYYSAAEKGDAEAMSRIEEEFLLQQEMGDWITENGEKWESSYNALYNINQKINTTLRERDSIERKYTQATWDMTTSAKEYAAIQREQVKNLQEEKDLQSQILAESQQNLSDTWVSGLQEWKDLVTFDPSTGEMIVDYESYESSTWAQNPELKAGFEAWIKSMEEEVDTIQSAEDAIWDNTKAQRDVYEQGRDATSSMFDRIRDALISQYEKEIEALSNINDTISETNEEIISNISKIISEQRKTRERNKTATSIADTEAQLAYLRQATGQSNASEILELNKSLDDQRTSFQDQLVDDALQKMEQLNDEAQRAREEQIALQQKQLQEYKNSQAIWTDVYSIINDTLNDTANGVPINETVAGKILTDAENVQSLNPYATQAWQSQLNQSFGLIDTFLQGENSKMAQAAKSEGYQEGYTEGYSTAENSWKEEYNKLDEKWQGDFNSLSSKNSALEGEINEWKTNYATLTTQVGDLTTQVEELQRQIETLKTKGAGGYSTTGGNTGVQVAVYDGTGGGGPSGGGGTFMFTYDYGNPLHMKLPWRGYATGGLADFTGPAWLDGTKSRPELVLNQTDTQNFIALKDILSDIMKNNIDTTENNPTGDNFFDIEINVESLSNDYDVEQVADKIRSMIYSDATRRNVNAVNQKI